MSKRTTSRKAGNNNTGAGQSAVATQSSSNLVLWAVGTLVLVGLIALVVWLSRQPTLVAAAEPTPTPPPTATPVAVLEKPDPAIASGTVDTCRKLPEFRKAVGFESQSAVLSTQERTVMGMIMYDPSNPNIPPYQHPSWTQAGYLGHVAIVNTGDIFVYPAPRVSLIENPPDKQNILYRVDNATGEMKPWMELPSTAAPSTENPFGLMGLAYDCETNTLYASSVAGSTRQQELGRIYRISLSEAKVLSTYDNVDAFGINIFKGSTGKRLYFASARTAEVRSVALNWQGEFAGNERVEVSLAGLGPVGDDRGRRIRWERNGDLLITGIEFRYNLVAQSEVRQTDYRFTYDINKDTWSYQQPQQ